MSKKFSFWIWGTIVTQFLTAAIHSVSFFIKLEAANETEKQLFNLMDTYKPDVGMGFNPSFADLFTGLSLCFTLICLFGALINLYFKRKGLDAGMWKGLLLIEVIIFGALFVGMAVFTFALPIICTALVFIFVTGSYFSVKK
ncbi:MAG: hypothetical protein ABIR78_04015 [Ferruginibacter sp.]